MKPIDLSTVSLTTEGIVYQGKPFAFNAIAHLRFARTAVTTYVVPIKLGTEGSVGMLVDFNTGESLYFREKPGWFFTSSQQKINGIVELYEYLAKVTFENRLQGYVTELRGRGYFTYSGFRFHPRKKSISRDGQEFTTDNTEFIKNYNYIELKPRKEGFLRKARMQLWGGSVIAIDTLTDTDVIFSLLAHFYGVRWT